MMPVHSLNIQGDERVYFEMKNILSQTVKFISNSVEKVLTN